MLFNLHWDGTGARGLSATPIVVGVANFNGQDVDAHFCVAYMPTHSLKLTSKEATSVKHYISKTTEIAPKYKEIMVYALWS